MSKNVAKEIDFNELGLYLCNKKEKANLTLILYNKVN